MSTRHLKLDKKILLKLHKEFFRFYQNKVTNLLNMYVHYQKTKITSSTNNKSNKNNLMTMKILTLWMKKNNQVKMMIKLKELTMLISKNLLKKMLLNF